MLRFMWGGLLAGALCATSASAATLPAPGQLKRDLAAMQKASRDHITKPDRVPLVEAMYEKYFAPFQQPATLRALSDADLATLYAAAYDAHFDAASMERLDAPRADLAELERRHVATKEQIEDYYGALFHTRAFAEMATFAKAHPQSGLHVPVSSSAPIVPGVRHQVLTIQDDHTVTPVQLDLDHGTVMVVVSSPGCHFAVNGMAAIDNDPDMRELMVRHSVWIAPPDGNPELEDYVSWNTAHPEARLALSSMDAGWPEITLWQTPAFLIFQDGKLVDEVDGADLPAVKQAWTKATAKAAPGAET